MYSARIIESDQFRSSRAVWNRLVSRMKYPSVFCTWEWIYSWWERFGESHTPIIVFIYDDTDVKGILPLFRRRTTRVSQWLRGAMLDYGGATEVYPDHLDIICAPEDVPACLTAAFDFLSERVPGWTWVRLPMLAQGSDLFRVFGAGGRWQVTVRQASTAPYLKLTGSFEDYLARLPKKDRYKIKSPRKKLLDDGKTRYEAFAPAEFETGLRVLFDLHRRRADVKGIMSTFDRPAIFEFHRLLLSRLGPEEVMLRCLRGEAGVVAALYALRCGGRIFFYQVGYDPEWSWAHPGIVLISEAIREAYREGCTEFNFLQGDEPYKHTFTHEARKLFDCSVYNTTLLARVARGAYQLREDLKAAVRRDVATYRTCLHAKLHPQSARNLRKEENAKETAARAGDKAEAIFPPNE